MNIRNILTVFAKELRDTLRDRRAVISMFLVPTILIPMMTVGFGVVSMKAVKKARQETPSIMIIGDEDSPALRQVFEKQTDLKIVEASADYADRISQKKLRAAIEIPPGFDDAIRDGSRSSIKIYTHDGEMRSGFATGAIERTLRDYRDKIVRERLSANSLSPDFIRPFDFRRENVAPPEKVGGNSFGGLIPYVFIILCFSGAMYPAIDLTTGEKERGTMETILCSPIARSELVLGKFFVVLTASLTTVACSICSMGLTALTSGGWLRDTMGTGVGAALPTVSIPGVLSVVVLVLPLAVLFSALLMTVALFAKSHKEAQTYVSPLLIIVILPAVGAVLPGVELTNTLSLVPILNIALISKELVAGTFPLLPLALIFLSTCVYAAAALALAVRMFNRESVIFRS
ncbi:MAG: ABC transporter permease [Nibricoccus sp.]